METLKQRLTPEFLVNKTNIFESLKPEDKARVFAEFKAYWNEWIQSDLEELFDNENKLIDER
jgi:hypothetical protein